MKVAIILLFLFVISSWSGNFDDRILVVVGDHIILESDLTTALLQNESIPAFALLNKLQKQTFVLNQIVDNKVLYTIAQKDTSIFITVSEIEKGLNFRLQQMIQQTGGTISQLKIALKQQGIFLVDFKKQLRKQIKEQILIQKLQSKYLLPRSQNLSSKQIEDFFYQFSNKIPDLVNNVNLSMIEVSVKSDNQTILTAYNLCDSVLQLLNSNEFTFEELASRFSDDPSSEDGGDLGFIKAGSIEPTYEKYAFHLPVNQTTKIPIRTKFGYHIIKVTDRKDREVRTSHILFLIEKTQQDEENTRKKMLLWKEQIQKKQLSFSTIATQFSEHKKSKLQQGLLGWFSYDNIPPEYKAIADTLKVDQISDPIWIDEKFYLFRVNGKKNRRKPTLEEDWSLLSQLAQRYYTEEKIKEKIKIWRETVYINNYSSISLQENSLILNHK